MSEDKCPPSVRRAQRILAQAPSAHLGSLRAKLLALRATRRQLQRQADLLLEALERPPVGELPAKTKKPPKRQKNSIPFWLDRASPLVKAEEGPHLRENLKAIKKLSVDGHRQALQDLKLYQQVGEAKLNFELLEVLDYYVDFAEALIQEAEELNCPQLVIQDFLGQPSADTRTD